MGTALGDDSLCGPLPQPLDRGQAQAYCEVVVDVQGGRGSGMGPQRLPLV